MRYYLITQTEDGLNIREGTAEEVKHMIADTDYYFFDHLPQVAQGYFLAGRIGHSESPGTPAVLIRGEIIVPQAKVVVTEYII